MGNRDLEATEKCYRDRFGQPSVSSIHKYKSNAADSTVEFAYLSKTEDLKREPEPFELALARLKSLDITAMDEKKLGRVQSAVAATSWNGDVLFKALPDLDALLFEGKLYGHLATQWCKADFFKSIRVHPCLLVESPWKSWKDLQIDLVQRDFPFSARKYPTYFVYLNVEAIFPHREKMWATFLYGLVHGWSLSFFQLR